MGEPPPAAQAFRRGRAGDSRPASTACAGIRGRRRSQRGALGTEQAEHQRNGGSRPRASWSRRRVGPLRVRRALRLHLVLGQRGGPTRGRWHADRSQYQEASRQPQSLVVRTGSSARRGRRCGSLGRPARVIPRGASEWSTTSASAATRASADHQERLLPVGRRCMIPTVNQDDVERRQRLVRLIDEWFARTSAPPAEVQPGSELGEDDRATDYLHVSHMVTTSLIHAVDHLHALRTLLVDARVLHTSADFTLIRSGLENAATAVWLMALRILRSVGCADSDWPWRMPRTPSRCSTWSSSRRDPSRSAARTSLTSPHGPVLRSQRWTRQPGFEAIVRAASHHVGDGDLHQLVWRDAAALRMAVSGPRSPYCTARSSLASTTSSCVR